MRWTLNGVAFIGLHDAKPRTIDEDRCGRPCENQHECATGEVRAISYAPSCARGAAAIYDVRPHEARGDVAARLGDGVLRYQRISGELEVVSILVPPLLADSRGRGEPPWDAIAELDEEIAVEFNPRLRGIRELRVRPKAMEQLDIGAPLEYRPGDDIEEIVAISRK